MSGPTITYNGRELDLPAFTQVRLRELDARCDCGAPELGHAPDCSWVLRGDDVAAHFADLVWEQGEADDAP